MSNPFRWQGEPPYAAKRLKERRLIDGIGDEWEKRRSAVMACLKPSQPHPKCLSDRPLAGADLRDRSMNAKRSIELGSLL